MIAQNAEYFLETPTKTNSSNCPEFLAISMFYICFLLFFTSFTDVLWHCGRVGAGRARAWAHYDGD